MYALRHTFATLARTAGEGASNVSRQLGHSKSTLVDAVYSHSLALGLAAMSERVTARAFGTTLQLRLIDGGRCGREPLKSMEKKVRKRLQLVDYIGSRGWNRTRHGKSLIHANRVKRSPELPANLPSRRRTFGLSDADGRSSLENAIDREDERTARNASASIACNLASAALALLAFTIHRRSDMAQLMVRNLAADLVKALKQRAAKHNRSAEQEHREILQAALQGPRRRPLAEVLAAMPNVGEDQDFVRQQSDRRG
jgi:antitoxin FitA